MREIILRLQYYRLGDCINWKYIALMMMDGTLCQIFKYLMPSTYMLIKLLPKYSPRFLWKYSLNNLANCGR